jgi:chemotaxis protein MotA
MDPATGIGLFLALGAVFGSMFMEGGDPAAIMLPAPLILVFGGTIGAAVAGGVLKDGIGLPKGIIRALTAKNTAPNETIDTIVHLADRARREGMLALEEELPGIENPFLKRGLQMAVDGTDAETVADILGAEVDTKRAAGKQSAKIFQDMSGYAPTIGIIGTVLGLIHVLGNLGQPAELGAKIASAFVATLWGVMTANIFWLPMAHRLKRVNELECSHMNLIIEGILAIQAGANPRLVVQKLKSLLPAEDVKDEAA